MEKFEERVICANSFKFENPEVQGSYDLSLMFLARVASSIKVVRENSSDFEPNQETDEFIEGMIKAIILATISVYSDHGKKEALEFHKSLKVLRKSEVKDRLI